MGANMKLIKERYLGIIVSVVASYVLATHFAFQWYTSIILCFVILGVMVGLNTLIHKLSMNPARQDLVNRLRPFIAIFIIIAVAVVPKYDGREEYDDCSYPPFRIIEDTKMDYNELFESFYYEEEGFTGFLTFGNNIVDSYNTITKESTRFSFTSRGSEIYHVVYYEGYIYSSGAYLRLERSTSQSVYQLYRYNIETGENEFLFDSENYISLYTFADSLVLHANLDGTRQYHYYQGDFNLVRSEVDELDYIYRADSFDTIDVVQRESGIYLYKNNTLLREFETPSGGYNDHKYIYLYNDKFYITSNVIDDTYYIDEYDLDANFISRLTDYEVDDHDNYLLFTEHYVIENNALNMDELVIWDSTVMDLDGNDICTEISASDLKIIYKNQTLYGLYNGSMYEIEEMHYTVPFQYESPQYGFIFSISLAFVAFLSVKKEYVFLR